MEEEDELNSSYFSDDYKNDDNNHGKVVFAKAMDSTNFLGSFYDHESASVSDSPFEGEYPNRLNTTSSFANASMISLLSPQVSDLHEFISNKPDSIRGMQKAEVDDLMRTISHQDFSNSDVGVLKKVIQDVKKLDVDSEDDERWNEFHMLKEKSINCLKKMAHKKQNVNNLSENVLDKHKKRRERKEQQYENKLNTMKNEGSSEEEVLFSSKRSDYDPAYDSPAESHDVQDDVRLLKNKKRSKRKKKKTFE